MRRPQRIAARPRAKRDLLGLSASTPALAIERLALRDTMPVEWRHGLVRADRFSCIARWSAQNLGIGFELAAGGQGKPAVSRTTGVGESAVAGLGHGWPVRGWKPEQSTRIHVILPAATSA